MIIDCGFWDINGDYIEDFQELNEIEAQEVLRKPKNPLCVTATNTLKYIKIH